MEKVLLACIPASPAEFVDALIANAIAATEQRRTLIAKDPTNAAAVEAMPWSKIPGKMGHMGVMAFRIGKTLPLDSQSAKS